MRALFEEAESKQASMFHINFINFILFQDAKSFCAFRYFKQSFNPSGPWNTAPTSQSKRAVQLNSE